MKFFIAFLVLTSAVQGQSLVFSDVTDEAGISHRYTPDFGGGGLSREWSWISGGAVAEDFDGDGWIDLFVLMGPGEEALLYRNLTDGTFAEEGASRGANVDGRFMATAAADFDNDGDIDIAVSSFDANNRLLINDGSGNFSVVTNAIPKPEAFGSGLSWGDLDGDGDLELAVGAWASGSQAGLYIYDNPGGGELELKQVFLCPWHFSPRFVDLDNDGDQDLIAVADFGNTLFYTNIDGLLYPEGNSDVENGMGIAVGDINGDQYSDVFISSIRDLNGAERTWGTSGNRLLLNSGSESFADITSSAGVRDGNWGWGSEFVDFDHDGDLDLFSVTGFQTTSYDPQFSPEFSNSPARLWQNEGDLTFSEIATAAGAEAKSQQGRCAIAFDYDNDGDQDLFVVNNSETIFLPDGSVELKGGDPVLLRNDTSSSNRWLQVQLEGRSAPHHSHGIGSRIVARVGELKVMRDLNASATFNGHGPRRIAEFGFGDDAGEIELEVYWPNGDRTTIFNAPANDRMSIGSSLAELNSRAVNVGEAVVLGLGGTEIPAGGEAVWFLNGTALANQGSIAFDSPGEYLISLSVSDGDGGMTRSDSFHLTVHDLERPERSIARVWNEQALQAIRVDFPDPTQHARNLFHLSAAMWDAWAYYQEDATGYLTFEKSPLVPSSGTVREAISYAAFRILNNRYSSSANASTVMASIGQEMARLGLDPAVTGTEGESPAAVGNRIAAAILELSESDRASSLDGFLGEEYENVNDFLELAESGTTMVDPNRWQRLEFTEARSQNGQVTKTKQSFVGPNWGAVRTFSLGTLTDDEILYLDPGPPPLLDTATDAAFKNGALEVIRASFELGLAGSQMIDISPASFGNSPLGSNSGTGRSLNEVTGQPYAENMVPLADFGRVLAEFWADGPRSETPPGHWNVLANEVSESDGFERRMMGKGPLVSPLEWDVKTYFALNGALHDAAIVAWASKRVYDYVRPVSGVRYLSGKGQSSDPNLPSFSEQGIFLESGLVELITPESSAVGQRHEDLADHIGEIAIRAWAATEPGDFDAVGEVRWIRGVDWLPYQASTFVTPAFPGYVSGHSVFSRAGAEVLTRMTGSPYFPGGKGSFTAHKDAFLKFDKGPSVELTLEWATYYDAADQAGLSRIYGGIHFPVDDGPGRIMGSECGKRAFAKASQFFDGTAERLEDVLIVDEIEGNRTQIKLSTLLGREYQLESSSDLSNGSFSPLTPWFKAIENFHFETEMNPQAEKNFYRVRQKR